MSSLADETRTLLVRALPAFEGDAAAQIAAALDRMDEPLRVAIAGKVKAGKSTLLNALVGDELAPTDAGECTRIVTWYTDGHTYRVEALLADGDRRQLRFHRDDGAIEIDLGDLAVDDVRSLHVTWPTPRLRDLNLIDTPGIESIHRTVSARTLDFLVADRAGPQTADAVLYLMRHLHGADMRFLESFHDDELAHASPVNAIGVLSRADEIGAGRLDAMASATRIADRYRHDPRLRRLCQTVVPVAGLLAQAAATLSEHDFRALGQLATDGDVDLDSLLLSADRFRADDDTVPVGPGERARLLDRFGLHGVRVALDVLGRGEAATAGALAHALLGRSGLPELRGELVHRFGARADVLRARSALRLLDELLAASSGTEEVAAEYERVMAGAHELAELRLLNLLHLGAVPFTDDELSAAETLLVAPSPARGLGLDDTASDDDVRAAAYAAIGRWQARAESPMSPQPVRDAARTLVRSLEGVVAATV